MQGIIAFYDPRKSYGFISTNTEDFFFHRNDLPEKFKHLRFKDCPCWFEIGQFRGRRCAVSVVPLNQSAQVGQEIPLDPLALLGSPDRGA